MGFLIAAHTAKGLFVNGLILNKKERCYLSYVDLNNTYIKAFTCY